MYNTTNEQVFFIQNNLCEFTALTHNVKRLYGTQKQGLKIS